MIDQSPSKIGRETCPCNRSVVCACQAALSRPSLSRRNTVTKGSDLEKVERKKCSHPAQKGRTPQAEALVFGPLQSQRAVCQRLSTALSKAVMSLDDYDGSLLHALFQPPQDVLTVVRKFMMPHELGALVCTCKSARINA